MDLSDNSLFLLASILFFGLLIPQFFRRIRMSFVISVVVIGAMLGPSGLDYIAVDDTIKTFAFLGAAFHMLLAGFESESLHLNKAPRKLWLLVLINFLVPFGCGLLLMRWAGYGWESSLFMAILFSSSSVMVVFSTFNSFGLGNSRLGETIKSLAVVQDISSSLLVFLIFKYLDPHARFSLPILLGLVISSIAILRMFLPEVTGYFFQRFEKATDEYESKLKLIIVLLLVVLLGFSTPDVHPIIAAFLVGFTLAGIPDAVELKNKLATIGHAMFIPVFLFTVGMELDLSLFQQLDLRSYLILGAFLVVIFSKFISGFVGARLAAFDRGESTIIGISTVPKLAVAISAAFAGHALDIIDDTQYAIIVTASVATTVIGPILLALLINRRKEARHA